ncbi:MAG: hypothetical protein AAF368_00300, partial [Planctomycetota bacterium]
MGEQALDALSDQELFFKPEDFDQLLGQLRFALAQFVFVAACIRSQHSLYYSALIDPMPQRFSLARGLGFGVWGL